MPYVALSLRDAPSFAQRLWRASFAPIQLDVCSERRMVEPEVVATSPYRIKSPVPVCCGFDSLKLACQAVARGGNRASPPSPRYGAAAFALSCVASEGWWAREDLHLQGSQILDLWGLLFPLNHSPENWNPRTKCRMQNAEFGMQNGKRPAIQPHSAFCILHFAFGTGVPERLRSGDLLHER